MERRSFTHTRFCDRVHRGEVHEAHFLGQTYRTNNYGTVERWCRGHGDGPGTIEIVVPGSPESLPVWRLR